MVITWAYSRLTDKKMYISVYKGKSVENYQGWNSKFLSRVGKELSLKWWFKQYRFPVYLAFFILKTLCEEIERMVSTYL